MAANIHLTRISSMQNTDPHRHTHLTALCLGLPGWADTRKVKPIWILLKQETGSGSGISLAVCKSAHHSRQITMPVPHHSVFYRPDALPATQPTASKHWRPKHWRPLLIHIHCSIKCSMKTMVYTAYIAVFIPVCFVGPDDNAALPTTDKTYMFWDSLTTK